MGAISLRNVNACADLNAADLKCFNALLFLREFVQLLESFFFLSDRGSQPYNNQGLTVWHVLEKPFTQSLCPVCKAVCTHLNPSERVWEQRNKGSSPLTFTLHRAVSLKSPSSI